MKKSDIETIQNKWSKAIIQKDIDKLLALYSAKAILKPTLSNIIRTNQEAIRAYFLGSTEYNDTGFMNNQITQINFLERNPRIIGDLGIDLGKYSFIIKGSETIEAHYTFTFINEDGNMKILSQHSSILI